MAERDGGGPAFPNDGEYRGHRGMSLRDWFAGQALAALVPQQELEIHVSARARNAAAQAYEYADAMLLAREGKL